MRTRTRLVLAALVVLGLLTTACSSDDSSSSDDTTPQGEAAENRNEQALADEADLEPVDGGELTFAVEAESDGFNPVAHRWSYAGNLIASTVYEPLMAVTPDRGVEPWLAESVEPNDDGTVWTITARDDITFQDGSPFDAEVIAANLQARRDGLLTGLATEPIERIDVTDERTVVVTMKSPWAQWDKSLASQSGYMMSMTNVADPEADPIGTGPFQWVEWVPDNRVVVERYDDYWGEPAHLDGIEFKVIVDPDSRVQALEAGDVDAIMTQDAPAIADLRDSDYTVIEDGQGDTAVVMLNAGQAPFDNPTARAAITAATDNEKLVDVRYDGAVELADGPFAQEEIWYTDDNGYTGYDPEAAAELVAQYEEETGGPLQLTLKGSQGSETEDNMQVLAAQWAEVGIETDIEPVEQAAIIGQVVVGDYEAAMFRNFSWADPDFNYLFWHSDNAKGVGEISVNFTQTVDDDLDAGVVAGREAFDDDLAARKEAYAQVTRALNEEHAYIWLFHSLGAIMSQPDVHGWQEAADRGFYRQDAKTWWQDLWIEQ